MTKEEAVQKIKELEEYIKNINQSVGYGDDEIFLLSSEEYDRYKQNIPKIAILWWLRTPGGNQKTASTVYGNGSIYYSGDYVYYDCGAIRPALKIFDKAFKDIEVGNRYIKYDFPWIKVDENLAIAELPIGFCRFDIESNDYKTSEIRKYINEWKECRK